MNVLQSVAPHWIWLGLTVIFVLIEVGTTALVSIWFVAGSLAALLASFFTDSGIAQTMVFAVVSAAALVVTRPLVRKLRSPTPAATGADRNVGRTGTVLEAIRPEKPGRVRLDGVDWSATCTQPLEEGALCTVLAVHGTALAVSPYSPDTDASV